MEGQSSLRAKVLQQLQEDIQIAQSLYDSPEATIQGNKPFLHKQFVLILSMATRHYI